VTSLTPAPSAGLAFPFLRQRASGEAAGVRGDRDPRALLLGDGTARYLRDVLHTMGEHVDALKFAGGSFTLMPETALRELIEIVDEHNVLVSTRADHARPPARHGW
jgi:hypothetical protein